MKVHETSAASDAAKAIAEKKIGFQDIFESCVMGEKNPPAVKK